VVGRGVAAPANAIAEPLSLTVLGQSCIEQGGSLKCSGTGRGWGWMGPCGCQAGTDFQLFRLTTPRPYRTITVAKGRW
jgi:hypothetical protein